MSDNNAKTQVIEPRLYKKADSLSEPPRPNINITPRTYISHLFLPTILPTATMSFKTTITKLFSTKSDAKSVTSVETISLKSTASTISGVGHQDTRNTPLLSASKGGRARGRTELPAQRQNPDGICRHPEPAEHVNAYIFYCRPFLCLYRISLFS
ncbi:hypothetical protein DL89DRAFT_21725 [Linderina pennispora]|uniref:Uncharacterized protein n=1 Tax=Linderina pennispora TaxID=61395 RepID=A0A1Y1WNC0_9FUNG|nr:uncharacterized protein DL89DRAFT_21725 [Linderina pennispora]ORX74716.1 hypothetical protein DL89DRAFT_21725 [Linderina pennispora]